MNLMTLRTEVYRKVEKFWTVGAFVISIMVLGRLGRREFAAAGTGLDDQLTTRQFRFQRLAIPSPPNGIIILQIHALDFPRLSLAHDLVSFIFHWGKKKIICVKFVYKFVLERTVTRHNFILNLTL